MSKPIFTANSKKPIKAHRVYTKMSISLNVGITELVLPFGYFPTKKELDEVVEFVLDEVNMSDPPVLIDLSNSPNTEKDASPPYAPHCIEFPHCNHPVVRCGKFYGGVCKGVTAKDTEHHHTILSTCGFCLAPKPNCLPTGNSTEFVCSACCLAEVSHNFCVICERFEETNEDTHCGKCQYVLEQEEGQDIQDESDRSEDEEEEVAELTTEGYAKDGFVVSDSELSPSPIRPRRRNHIQTEESQSFHDTQWDLIHEPI